MTDVLPSPANAYAPAEDADLSSSYLAQRRESRADQLIREARDRLALDRTQEPGTRGQEAPPIPAAEPTATAAPRDFETGTEAPPPDFGGEPKAPAGGQARDLAGKAIAAVGGNIRDLPLQVVGGIADAARETLRSADELGTWLNENVADLAIELPSSGSETIDAVGRLIFGNPLKGAQDVLPQVPESEHTLPQFARPVAQFLTGFVGAGKLIGTAKGTGQAARYVNALARGAVSDAFAFDPDNGNLANFLGEVPVLKGPVTEFLATDPADGDAENRLKNAVVGAGLGLATDGLVAAFRFYRGRARAAAAAEQAGGAPGAGTAAPDAAPAGETPASATGSATAGEPPVRDFLVLGDPEAPLVLSRPVERPAAAVRAELKGVPEQDLPIIVARIRAAARPDRPRAAFTGDVPFKAGGRSLIRHPDFTAAKAGDDAAAGRLVSDLLPDELVEGVRAAAGDGPVIIAYGRREGGNAIAQAVAERLASLLPDATVARFGQEGAKHRGAAAAERMMSQAEFSGEVARGGRYLLVDDYLTLGSTMADLRSRITDEGGDVVGLATLGRDRFTTRFAPEAATLDQLRAKFPDLEDDWLEVTGAPFEALTEAEAKALLRFSDEGALKERVLQIATARGVKEAGPLGTGVAWGQPSRAASPEEAADIDRLRTTLAKPPQTAFDASGIAPGAVRPAEDLPAYVRDVAKASPDKRNLPRFLFGLGRWPTRLRDQAAAFVARFRETTGDELRVSNEVIDKLYRQNAREADRLLAEIPDLLRDGEVLPNPQREDRVLLARPFTRSTGQPTNHVAAIEIARSADGYEVVSIHMSPDRTLAKARELARQSRGEGGSDAGGAAGSSFGEPGSPAPAAADFPAVGTTPEEQHISRPNLHQPDADRESQALPWRPAEQPAALGSSSPGAQGSTFDVAPGEVFINWARIDGPDDVKAAIQQVADARSADIDAARRGVRSHADTRAAAAAEDAWQVLMERRSQGGNAPLNAERTLAVRELWTASGAKLIEVAQLAAANPSEANLFAFRKMLAGHHLIQREAIAARTETARALESWKIPAGGPRERLRALEDVLTGMGGSELHREMAKRVALLADNPRALDAFADRAARATTMDAVREVWVNALLSSPTTHLVNVTSNAMVMAQQIYERWTAQQISALRAASGGVEPGEAAAMLHGLISGFWDALRLGGRRLILGDGEQAFGGKVDVRQNTIRGATFGAENTPVGRAIDYLGHAVNLPSRFLGAEDVIFRSIGYRMELHAQAVRAAASEGLTGSQFAARVRAIIADPPESVRIAAQDQALYATFTDKAGALGEGLLRLREQVPVLSFILPFVRTPANILSYALERTPLAPLVKMWREDVRAGGARGDLALARMSTGTMILLTTADLAERGLITGGGPDDPGELENLRNQGWQPYSVKVGDAWYAYNRLDPLGMTLGMAADMTEMARRYEIEPEEVDEATEIVATGIAAIARVAISKTYLQGLSDFVEMLSDPERYSAGWINKFFASFVPAGAAATARALDPVQRDINSLWDHFQARLPELSKDLTPRRNRWGEPVQPSSGVGSWFDAFSPVKVSREKQSPVDAELERLNANIPPPKKRTSFAGVDVNFRAWPEAWDEYRRLAGGALKHPAYGLGAKELLNQVVAGEHPLSSIYRLKPDGDGAGSKGEWIRGVLADYRELAQRALLTAPEYEQPFAQFRAHIRDQQAAARRAKLDAMGAGP